MIGLTLVKDTRHHFCTECFYGQPVDIVWNCGLLTAAMQSPYSTGKAYAELHFAVLLFGFTAILGRLISLEEGLLVWYRMGITALSLLLFPGLLTRVRAIPRTNRWQLAGIGVLVALHWVTFFGSIKASTVSVALSCMGTMSLFTALLEPLIRRIPVRREDLLLGLFVIPGMYLIHRFSGPYHTGIALGVLSAALAALFSVLNKSQVARFDALSITWLELGSGWIFLTLCLPWIWPHGSNPDSGSVWAVLPSAYDWLWLLLLSLVCTTLAYVLALRALSSLSPFSYSLAINLEPVYGILLAMVLFREHRELNTGFFVGAAMILLSLLLHPWLRRQVERRRSASS